MFKGVNEEEINFLRLTRFVTRFCTNVLNRTRPNLIYTTLLAMAISGHSSARICVSLRHRPRKSTLITIIVYITW